MGYVRRVRDACRAAREADDALQADGYRRENNDGPWIEDDTYLDLNEKAWDTAKQRNRVIRGKG